MKAIEEERWLRDDNHCYSTGRVSRLPYHANEGFVTSYRVTYLTWVDIARVRLSFVAQLMLGCKSY